MTQVAGIVEEKRYSISEAAPLLDRSAHTLRSWDRNKSMPKELKPKRDKNGHRYWTDELIRDIKTWMIENDFHPGRGIEYHPTEEELGKHISRIRRSTQAKVKTAKAPHETELRDLITDALDQEIATREHIVEALPQVIEQYDGLSLADALRIAGDVFGKYE